MEWWMWLLLIIIVIAIALAIWWWWRQSQQRQSSAPWISSAAPSAPAAAPRMEPRIEPPMEAAPAPEPEAAPTMATGSDKLELIEGIGPKIAGVLQASGIGTFAQLAATDTARLEQILRDADLPLAKPATWAAQARLAAAGKWDELKQMQDSLKGGQ